MMEPQQSECLSDFISGDSEQSPSTICLPSSSVEFLFGLTMGSF